MEPLMLRPKAAFDLIGVKNTLGYQLIKAGGSQTVKLGRATLIPIESVKAFATRLQEQQLKAA